ncbi:MAG: outer membrane protein assembly factor BamE [Pseudomonadota bacterium]
MNQPVSPGLVAQLQPGVTTAKEVVDALGAPTEVVQLGYRSAYRYDRTVTKDTALFLVLFALRGSDARQDRIWVFFNEDEILTHVGTTFAADRTRYKLPWSRLHPRTAE